MLIKSVEKNNISPSFGVVRGNRAGFNRLYRSLGADTARSFIKSQKENKIADILLKGDKVKVAYAGQIYDMQNYTKTKCDELILSDDSHFWACDGGKFGFDIFPTDYPMYLDHLCEHWAIVPFKHKNKRGIFVTDTEMKYIDNFSGDNVVYSNAKNMASHLNKFAQNGTYIRERIILENKSWAKTYEKMMKKEIS